jgi:transposase
MTEVSNGEIQTAAMDHYGLVAAICQDLNLAEKIDSRLPKDPQRKVSPGTAVIAMIINGLGFTNRRLYLTHQFFESKPITKLLGQNLEAKDITDYTLGHALDDIAEYNASQLFAEIAFEIALDHNMLGSNNHLDTTSMLVHGEYDVDDDWGVTKSGILPKIQQLFPHKFQSIPVQFFCRSAFEHSSLSSFAVL